MSELIEAADPKPLKWLLDQIEAKEVALPDFQRDFVWEAPATEELICSLAQNYPAGALLAIRNSKDTFQPREFAGAPSLNGQRPNYLILDGQQRLTSLYQAFFKAGEYQYFINLQKLLDGLELEEAVFHLKANAKRGRQSQLMKRYSEFRSQAEELVFPFGMLFSSKDGFGGWADEVAEHLHENGAERKEFKAKLRDLRAEYIKPLEDYKFPFVLLSENTPADAVCTIFETLNRTGVKLSMFDLLAARFWPANVKLRDLWDGAKKRSAILADYEIDPYTLLQVLALTMKRQPLTDGRSPLPTCTRKDVLSLDAKDVAERWDAIVDSVASTLEMLRDDCGVLISKWLPYTTMISPMAAVLYDLSSLKGLDKGASRQKLRRWYWCSVFSQSYDSAANYRAAQDYVDVMKWMQSGTLPGVVAKFALDGELLETATPKQRAFYTGVISLILSRNPRDFHSQKTITRLTLSEQGIDDHHIFPAAYLQRMGVKEAWVRDCILNRTLIDRETNQRLGANPPSKYFAEIRGSLPPAVLKELLDSHLIPSRSDSPLFTDDYSGFTKERLGLITSLIKDVTE